MVEGADLYSILMSYANKNNSPYIEIGSFLEQLGRSAKKYAKEYPAWKKWIHDTAVKFWSEMSVLIEGNKCELMADSNNGRIFMSSYYPDALAGTFKYTNENADQPFPSEESLRYTLPETQVKILDADYDLLSYLINPKQVEAPILKINFPEGFGSALVLTTMVPRDISEMALLKIRSYLNRYGNKEYAFHKLLPLLPGKDSYIKDQLEQIILRPMDLFRAIVENKELTSNFWAHFCSLLKNDIKKKNEHLALDIAAYQAVYIIEVVNGYYRSVALKRYEAELAFRNLEACLTKPPYLYTMDEIIKFTNPNGTLLLNQYSGEQLEAWIRKNISESKDDGLPALLIVKIPTKSEQCFVLKEKLLTLCARLLADARIQIKSKITKRWSKLIYDYKDEAAMQDDEEFENALEKLAEKHCPELMALLDDPKLLVVYMEMERKENGIPQAVRIFYKEKLLPYSAIFFVKRKDILQDAKLSLPVWYSMPMLSAIIGFFKRLFKKRKAAKKTLADELGGEQEILEEGDRAGAIRVAAEELEFDLVPAGYTLDEYLRELEDRWSRLINKMARENLVADVQFLAKDHLKRTFKFNPQFKPVREEMNIMAENLVTRNQALSSLRARDSLVLYIELYMIKLLTNIK